jgi:hypothetical protein
MFRHFSFVTKYSILLCALCVSAVQSNAQLTDAQKAEREAKLLRKYDANRSIRRFKPFLRPPEGFLLRIQKVCHFAIVSTQPAQI